MTYRIQDEPDSSAKDHRGSELTPVLTLKDGHGGISHICVDDHCYVLYNGGLGRPFNSSAHWYREAVAALMSLPPDPDEAWRQRIARSS